MQSGNRGNYLPNRTAITRMQDPFITSISFTVDFESVWGHKPVCLFCRQPILPSEIVRWVIIGGPWEKEVVVQGKKMYGIKTLEGYRLVRRIGLVHAVRVYNNGFVTCIGRVSNGRLKKCGRAKWDSWQLDFKNKEYDIVKWEMEQKKLRWERKRKELVR